MVIISRPPLIIWVDCHSMPSHKTQWSIKVPSLRWKRRTMRDLHMDSCRCVLVCCCWTSQIDNHTTRVINRPRGALVVAQYTMVGFGEEKRRLRCSVVKLVKIKIIKMVDDTNNSNKTNSALLLDRVYEQ